MARQLMPKSGIMMPYVVVSRDAAVVGVSTVDGLAGAIDLTKKYMKITDADSKYAIKSDTYTKSEVQGLLSPIMEGALFKDDPYVNNNTAIRSGGGNNVESVDMIKVSPENEIILGDYSSGVQGVKIHTAGQLEIIDTDDGGVERVDKVYSTAHRPETSQVPFAAIGSYVLDSQGRTVGVNKTGVNSDIKQLTGLTTPLSISQGGSGSSNVNDARTVFKVEKHIQGSDRTLIQSPKSGDDTYALMVHQSGVWGCYNEKNSQYVALQLDKGGTGAKDAAGARKNIGIDGFGLGLSSGAGVIGNATEGSSVNLANGFYATNGDFVGTPFGVGNGQFLGLVSFNCTNSNNYKFQLAGSYSGSGRMFFRSMNNGSYRAWSEVASLQNANIWAQKQTCLSNFKSSTSWPALELDKTTIASGTVGRRIVIEHNDSSLNFYFANGSDNTGRYTIMMRKPVNSTYHYVGLDGGLAPDGRSNPSDTGNDFNTVYQGWRNIGGSCVNSPNGAAASNVYGSLFTQATQGLSVGRAKAQGVTGQWWQQRFYDTSNRIYSRIQTNNASWGAWQQVTMSAVSDERLKDIKGNLNVEDALDNINQMEFKLFSFKEEMIQGKPKTIRRGVISQQIKTIDEEYVRNVGGYLHLDQTPMLLDGLAAIKALHARDEANKAEIESLKKEIEELKSLISQTKLN